jgi:uncharacterized phage infection (PIP) family protein YhgE
MTMEAPETEEQNETETEGQDQGAGGIGDLISQLYDGLNILSEVINKAQGVAPDLKKQMAQLLQGFEGVAAGLSGGPAQPAAQPATGAAPMMAGASGAMPSGPQTR